MIAVLHILRKTLVIEYYRLNTGFLFLVLMFAFGILRPEDHIALSAYVFASPFLLTLVFVFFALYHLKTVFFVRQRLLWDSHDFLFHLVLLPQRERWFALWYVQMMLWLPVLLYVVFVGYYGWKIGQQTAVLLTFLYLFLIPFTGIAAYEYRLFHPNPDSKLSRFSGYLNRRFTKPYWSYFILYLFKENPVLLFLTKGFTCFVILGVCKIYPTDSYDERLLSLGVLTVGMVHSVLLLHLYEFEHLQLPLLRNLPLTLRQRSFQYFQLFLLLLLPEALFLARYLPVGVSWVYAVQGWGLMVSILWLLFGRFLQRHYLMDTLLRQGFYAFILGFFLIMFRVPAGLLALAAALSGIELFRRFYYRSEYIVHEEGLKIRPED
ncbi:MAG: hypothetical protein U0X91_19345 [Spirosomataceae bacterium]